jgi:hypothetical protein
MGELRKSQSHGRIGEAATYAKCWMHGIPAYHTGGLRANFRGSDLIVETSDPRTKLWIQVKTGAPILKGHVYVTQCGGDDDLKLDKFEADFLVLVNLDNRRAKQHVHDGTLGFADLSFYVLPRKAANSIYRKAVRYWGRRPKRDGGKRKLANMAVHVPASQMDQYRDAWRLVHAATNKELEPAPN